VALEHGPAVDAVGLGVGHGQEKIGHTLAAQHRLDTAPVPGDQGLEQGRQHHDDDEVQRKPGP
jgi:hypothetical protein